MTAETEWITVALLYRKTSRRGTSFHFGRWGTGGDAVRLYLFEHERDAALNATGQPAYRLTVRAEDYAKIEERMKGKRVKP